MNMTALESLTLVTGGEGILVERAVDGVIARARRLDPGVEVRHIDARTAGAAGLVQEACSPTLFGGGSVVVVAGLDAADEAVVRSLQSVLAQPGGSAWVVALLGNAARGKKARTMLEPLANETVDCPEIGRGRALSDFAMREIRRQRKLATAEAVALLVSVSGSDVREIAAACSQLCSDVEERSITATHVRQYLGSVAEVTAFEISDAVLDRQPAKALELLRTAELGDRGSLGPSVVAALARGLRQIARFQAAPPGMSDRDLAAEVGAPPWRLRLLARQARLWRPETVAGAFLVLGEADAAAKGGLRRGDQLDPHQKGLALERLVARLAGRGQAD